jgi:hypothetical protein
MKAYTTRNGFVIEPEGPPDELYCEQVLGFAGAGAEVVFVPPPKNSDKWGALVVRAAKPQPVEQPAQPAEKAAAE